MPLDRVPVNMLDPSTGTPGQVATIGPLGNIVGFEDPATGATLAWFNVKDYGAVGDGIVDDTTAIDAAIAALNAAGGGVLYFPAGIYKVTAALTTINVPCTILGDGCADSHFRGASTTVRTNSRTINLFTIGTSGHGTGWSNLSLVNNVSTATPPTAGSAVHILGGDGATYDRLTISGFYINMDMEDGQEWSMQRCFLYSPVKYAMRLRHVDLPDGGDMGITNCQFLAGDYDADAAIRWESGGGLRFTNNKINARTLTHKFGIGIDAHITVVTGVAVIALNSIENVVNECIKGDIAPFCGMQGVVICGNELAHYTSSSVPAISITLWNDVTVFGNTSLGISGSFPTASIKLDTVTHGWVGMNVYEGYASEVTLTSCTDVKTLLSSARQVATGTGLTGGGDLSADRTIAIDTTSEAERIRDVIGAALVQGSGITITVDDAGDTITISATATATATGGGLVPITALDSGGNLTFLTAEDGSLITAEVLS